MPVVGRGGDGIDIAIIEQAPGFDTPPDRPADQRGRLVETAPADFRGDRSDVGLGSEVEDVALPMSPLPRYPTPTRSLAPRTRVSRAVERAEAAPAWTKPWRLKGPALVSIRASLRASRRFDPKARGAFPGLRGHPPFAPRKVG